jgi:hypothetical protein
VKLHSYKVIEHLRSPPDNLTTIPNPTIDDPDAYNDALNSLPISVSLYGATHTEPTSVWSTKALEWTTTGLDQPSVVTWASRALSGGTFDSQAWFEALSDDGNTVLREVLVQWGKDDLKVSDGSKPS